MSELTRIRKETAELLHAIKDLEWRTFGRKVHKTDVLDEAVSKLYAAKQVDAANVAVATDK